MPTLFPFADYGWFYALFTLVFVGVKMAWVNDALGGKFPITWSLGIIGAILAATMFASLILSRPNLHAPAPLRR